MGGIEEREAQRNKRTKRAREWIQRGLALALVIGVTVAVVLLADKLERFKAYGYPGIFLISLLGNATVILPAPSLVVVGGMGGVLNPILVGLCAGVGEALGELTGYLAGYSGRAVVEDRETYARLEGWMRRNGDLTILVLSMIPNPFFDIAGIAAGILRFPVWRFLVACWIGKTLKTLVVAHLGAQLVSLLRQLIP